MFRWFTSMATKSAVWESTTSVPPVPVSRRTCTQASVCLPILLNTGTSSQLLFAVWPDGEAFSLETSESRSMEWKQCFPDSSEVENCQYPCYSIRKELEIILIDKTRWNWIPKVLAVQEIREYFIILMYIRNCNTCCWMLVQFTQNFLDRGENTKQKSKLRALCWCWKLISNHNTTLCCCFLILTQLKIVYGGWMYT